MVCGFLLSILTQAEKLKNQQDEVAEIHDFLNVSERKLRGIKSFWGNLGNLFVKDKSQEHRNARQKYEKDLAKDKLKEADTKIKKEDVVMTEKAAAHQQSLKPYVDSQNDSLKQAKEQSKTQVKSGTATSPGSNNIVAGKFVFAERNDTTQKCEAECDLDDIGDYVSQLKQKAMVMGGAIDESATRLDNLNVEMDRAHSRTKASNKKVNSILNS
jgi:hypothetical protein